MREKEELTLSGALLDLVQGELVDRGTLGEVLTKYMLTRAFDEAVSATDARQYVVSVTLKSFLNSLGLDTDEVTKCKPRDATSADKRLGHYFDARLSLAQWLRCEDDEFDLATAEEAVLSPSALQAPPNYPDVDLMMVLTLDENRVVDASNLLVVLIQTKNRLRRTKVDLLDRTLKPFRAAGVPVIFIVHEVEVDPAESWSYKFKEHTSVRVSVLVNPKDPPTDKRPLLTETTPSARASPVFHLQLNGCPYGLVSLSTARDISKAQRNLFEELGHFNQGGVLTMQPFLTTKNHTGSQLPGYLFNSASPGV